MFARFSHFKRDEHKKTQKGICDLNKVTLLSKEELSISSFDTHEAVSP